MRKQSTWSTILILILLGGAVVSGCSTPAPGSEAEDKPSLGAGIRYSTYGPRYDPGPEYWADVAQQMASRFPGATPQVIWIVGNVHGLGTYLSFPTTSTSNRILGALSDENEEALTLFDELGIQVWLQVEPGDASVEELIHIMLEQYHRHPSVIGVGVDVEWYHSYNYPEGRAVTDEEAQAWLAAARSHGEQYRLFLKHWETEMMPPTVREGILFVDDSQQFDSLEKMVAEYAVWGETFAPAPVAFQYGYGGPDRKWWEKLNDPPGEIGRAILDAVPNTKALFWVDFTALEMFPPDGQNSQ